MKVRELGGFIRDQRSAARLSLRKLSSLTGVSNPYLSQIERGLRRPSADILQAIAKALRISAETLYVQAGILDERSDADPEGEIRRDNTLTERQKQMLIDLYQSFREGGSTTRRASAAKTSTAATRRGVRRAATKSSSAPAKAKKAKAKPRKRVAAARATTKKSATTAARGAKKAKAARKRSRR